MILIWLLANFVLMAVLSPLYSAKAQLLWQGSDLVILPPGLSKDVSGPQFQAGSCSLLNDLATPRVASVQVVSPPSQALIDLPPFFIGLPIVLFRWAERWQIAKTRLGLVLHYLGKPPFYYQFLFRLALF